MATIEKITATKPNNTLPNGTYKGLMSGYQIDITYNDELYTLHLSEGIRGRNYPVTVEVSGNNATYTFHE